MKQPFLRVILIFFTFGGWGICSALFCLRRSGGIIPPGPLVSGFHFRASSFSIKKPFIRKGFLKEALASFYFPTQDYAVSSTMEGLTAEFGMGSGVPPPPRTPRQFR